MSKIYELYLCTYKKEVVYVGQGVRGRHKHCNSGISHVFELNEIYFLEGANALEVEVVKQDTCKATISRMEVEYILSKKPRFNKSMNSDKVRRNNIEDSLKFRKTLKGISHYRLANKSTEKYNLLVDELLDYFGYVAIMNGNFLLEGKTVYQRLNKEHLRFLSRWLRSSKSSSTKSHFYVLQQQLKHICGYDITDKITKIRI